MEDSLAWSTAGADLAGGGGGANAFSPQGFDLLPTQGVHPLYYFEISILVTDPKIFLTWRGSAPKKNAIFWAKFSKKCLKTLFLACLFKILPAAQKIWPKQRVFSALRELRKSIWSILKKVDKIFEFLF